MITVKIICVGKLKEAFYQMAAEEYQKRLQPFCKLHIHELSEYRLPANPSPAQIRQGLVQEEKQILKYATGKIVPLCIEGRQTSSEELAQLLADTMQTPGTVSFLIGSSFGLSEEVKRKGSGISMSRMTFPHGLARVLLTEQLYRGFQILNGAKYHK